MKDFSSISSKFSSDQPPKKGADRKIPLKYGKAEVQILFEPLQSAISSMEFSKNFGDKKIAEPLEMTGFFAISSIVFGNHGGAGQI